MEHIVGEPEALDLRDVEADIKFIPLAEELGVCR